MGGLRRPITCRFGLLARLWVRTAAVAKTVRSCGCGLGCLTRNCGIGYNNLAILLSLGGDTDLRMTAFRRPADESRSSDLIQAHISASWHTSSCTTMVAEAAEAFVRPPVVDGKCRCGVRSIHVLCADSPHWLGQLHRAAERRCSGKLLVSREKSGLSAVVPLLCRRNTVCKP